MIAAAMAAASMDTDTEDRYIQSVVEAKGRIWGWQWRRNFGSRVSVSVASIAGQVQETGDTPLSPSYARNYPEVFLGDGLEFAAALKRVPEKHRLFAWVHYAAEDPAKVKAEALGIAISTYWQRRNYMRRAIGSALQM